MTSGRVMIALAAGHCGWAGLAYGRELREIAAAGLVDSVGDGLFRREHDRDERAAAFWFAFAGAVIALAGWLVDRAERRGDAAAVRGAGAAVTAMSVAGAAVMPRSGFAAGVPAGAWIYLRGRRSALGPGRDAQSP